jgi:hypothetical protein
MLKNLTTLILSLCLGTLFSCNSKLSTGKVEEIALIGANIEITQNPTDKKDNGISIDLFDDNGNSIINDSIKIILNGVEGELFHIKGLYYTDNSHYDFSNVPVNDKYIVEIKLTDGKKYLLGTINALSEEKIENIECLAKGDFNNDFLIKWHNLIDIDELSIFVGMTEKTANVTTMSQRDEKIIKIKNNGSYIIPRSEYKDSKSTINGITFNFRTTKIGIINPKLLESSKISIKKSIEKYVPFE